MNIKHLFKLKPYEHIVFILRRHYIFVVLDLVALIALSLIPIVAVYFLRLNSPTIMSGPVSFPLVILGTSLYLLAVWLFFFSMITNYYLDIWVVTNDRLIAVEQEGLFSRTVSEMDLWLVQDVTSQSNGIGATIFGYGSLFVQSAGEKGRFDFEALADPSMVRQKILDLADEDRKYHVGDVGLKKVGL
jgi:hypothetical protein